MTDIEEAQATLPRLGLLEEIRERDSKWQTATRFGTPSVVHADRAALLRLVDVQRLELRLRGTHLDLAERKALNAVLATPPPTDEDGACWFCLAYLNSGDSHNDGCVYLLEQRPPFVLNET